MLDYPISIAPEAWGAHFWAAIESVACTLSTHNKKDVLRFFDVLRRVLPCETCRGHYNEYCDQHPIHGYTENCVVLLMWVFRLRAAIRERNGQPPEDFRIYLQDLAERYDIPEIRYHIDKMHEYLAMRERHPRSVFLQKFRLDEFSVLFIPAAP
ncbi:hypothetical protein EBZ80_02395 [bacterium]|nr:hypothetical protein [bacterium]